MSLAYLVLKRGSRATARTRPRLRRPIDALRIRVTHRLEPTRTGRYRALAVEGTDALPDWHGSLPARPSTSQL